MIKFEIDREHHIQQLECAGSPVELAAEIGLMIQAIYAETSSINPIAGGDAQEALPGWHDGRFPGLAHRQRAQGKSGEQSYHHDQAAA
mgnify:CR=1 FL=1